MSKYVIVAESGADISPDMVERYGLQIVPMHVTIGDTTVDDGSISGGEIYARCDELGVMPRTSAATIHDFMVHFDRIHEDMPEATIIYLAYSAATTCSYESALNAAADRDYVVAIDTKSCSIGQSLVVRRTAEFIEENPDATVDEVMAFVEDVRDRVAVGFVPSDLAFLRAGGRLSNAKFLGAHLLKIKPVIEIVDGTFVATKKLRGSMAKASVAYLDHMVAKGKMNMERIGLAYSHGLAEDIKLTVEEHVRELGFASFDWVEVGGVISSHCGPNAFGAVMELAR